MTRLLILGLGNPLFGDDGAGIAALARLRARYDWPEEVARVLDIIDHPLQVSVKKVE